MKKKSKKSKKSKAGNVGVLVQARISEAAAKRLTRKAKAQGLRGRAALARAILEAAR